MKIIISILAVVLLWAAVNQYFYYSDKKLVEKVQLGELDLICNLHSGSKKVEPEKVVRFDSDTGIWEFTNGAAKSCSVVKPK